MLTVILFAAAIWIVIFQNRVREPVRLAADLAGGSADVRQVIGDPFEDREMDTRKPRGDER